MGITLSSADVGYLETALRTLLSPLDYPTLDQWRMAANRDVRTLLRADKAVFVLPATGGSPLLGDGVEDLALESYSQYYAAADVGLRRQRDLGLDVWTVLQLLEPVAHRKTEIWNDWKVPNSLWGATGLTVMVEDVAAGLICYDPREDPVLEERQVSLLRLVKAAFVTGVRVSRQLAAPGACLVRSVDSLPDPVGFYDLVGRLIHANAALSRVLDREPRREALITEMHAAATTLARFAENNSRDRPMPGVPGIREVEVDGRYRITAAFVGHGLLGRDTGILVTVTVLRPPLPSADSLRVRFRLTRREAAITLLLAKGLSNDRVAALLHISAHTARHHTESIFRKMEVHTRSDLVRGLAGL